MIQETYRDVEITYMETANVWRFTANGRERSTESLVKARESIDRALDSVKKEKAWKPFEAYYFSSNYDMTCQKVRVTSVAEDLDRQRQPQVWIVNDNEKYRGRGTRSKVSLSSLFAISPENDALLAEMARLAAEREAITTKIEGARKKLASVVIPDESAVAT